jgi:hypothetical protein
MSSYAVVEAILVILIGLVSAYQVMKVLMPRAMKRVRARIVNRLNGGPAHSLPTDLPDSGAASGCGVGCGDACNGCGSGAGIRQPLSGARKPSR